MSEESGGFRSRKGFLKSIITDEDCLLRIKDAVVRTHRITILVYQFIKAYYLHCFEQRLPLPTINENFIKIVFGVASTTEDARGGGFKGDNKIIFDRLIEFYHQHFRSTLAAEPLFRSHLSQVIHYALTTIRTVIENNIKMHFIKRLNGFVNSVWFHHYQSHIDQLPTKKAQKDFKHKLRLHLKKVKNDLMNRTLTSDPQFHPWILQIHPQIIPSSIIVSVPYDVKADPMKFFPGMIVMNRILESFGRKQFRCFPLRSEIIPGHIDLDTVALAELLQRPYKEYNGKGTIDALKPKIWGDNFNLSHKLFKSPRNKTFHHMIRTDGVSVVVLFAPIGYKKFVRKKPDPIEVDEPEEFPYLEDLTPAEIEEVRNAHRVYVDPNKGNLIYCIDDAKKTFRHTRWQRMHETKRLFTQQKIQRYKEKHEMIPIETQLSEENSKTCFFDRFIQYLRVKNQVNQQLFRHYDEEFFRKLKLKTFINTKRSEEKMINNLKKTYQTDDREVILIYGDCNVGKQMKGVISTPMIGMKRRLAKEFKVIHIDEFRTSCLHYKSQLRNKKATVTKANGETKKLHSVLVSKIPNSGRTGKSKSFYNRDRNAVLNMKKITKQFLRDGTRPTRYCRGYDLESSQWRIPLRLVVTGSMTDQTPPRVGPRLNVIRTG